MMSCGPLRYCLFNYSLFCRIPFNEDNYWPYGKKYGLLRSVPDIIWHFATNVIRISISEMHAKFSSQYLKAGDRFENVDVHKITLQCVIAGCRRDAEEIRALLGCYATNSGNSLPTFRHNLPFTFSWIKKCRKNVICMLNIGLWCDGSAVWCDDS